MKLRIETDENAEETEVVIRCREIDSEVAGIQNAVLTRAAGGAKIRLSKGGEDFFLRPDEILFFESEGGRTRAHTAGEVFETKLRLYELEEALPRGFLRVSKSAILNTGRIYSIAKNLTGPSIVSFRGSHKQISVSRQYFSLLSDRLER
ncbi:MAG: LytTR family transcriptional regulator [Clostridiales Family XIII bacterium]|jgi:DNA-binding LytR/AlgR family response regulator|nr:LytTR family transcriptional regulator [Clostridiales Family XIII bacterium]